MESTQTKHKGFKRIRFAAINSWNGLCVAYTDEAAFKQELLLLVIFGPIALFLPATLLEKLFMIFSYLSVLIVELLNTAIEAAVDRNSKEFHPLAKKAKDCASAAVLISIVFCVFVHAAIVLKYTAIG